MRNASRIPTCKTLLLTLLISAALHARADVPVFAQRLQTGLNKPIFVTSVPGDDSRLFIAEQGANGSANIRILNLNTNTLNPTPFLTITGLSTGTVSGGSEQGLLGLAFSPDYATNGLFYVNYTAASSGATVIRQYQVSGTNPDSATPSSGRTILTFAQPQANHNGGWLAFSPKDHYLYIGTGDGGNANDSGTGHTSGKGNAQDTSSLLGKILRIDVNNDDFPSDGLKNYAIPKGSATPGSPVKNPFAQGYNESTNPTGLDEIWAVGLRNPWRNSFDRKTGDLYIGDVGEAAREEVNFQSADATGGANYGWRVREGSIAGPGVNDNPRPADSELTSPIFDYTHDATTGGQAITGGYVYRGPENPALDGTYFFADYVKGKIWSTKYPGTGAATVKLIQDPQAATPLRLRTPDGSTIDTISSFGEDNQGHLYITDLGTGTNGELFRLVPAMPGDADTNFVVDHIDFQTLYTNFAPGITGKTWAQGDFNDDGIVDFADYQILERQYGKSIPFGTLPADPVSVPEPATLSLLALTLLCSRRRR